MKTGRVWRVQRALLPTIRPIGKGKEWRNVHARRASGPTGTGGRGLRALPASWGDDEREGCAADRPAMCAADERGC
ncbi:MAG: hypothetical protein ACXV5Q_17685, partial [Frankiaceae bacterium]